MLSLKNFEQYVEGKIVDRGFAYFENDCIENLEVVGAGEYSVSVLGREPYSVYIQLNPQGQVTEHTCTCPYDWGEVCKHRVAVLYYLVDNKDEIFESPDSKFSFLKNTLAACSREDLENLVVDIAKRDHTFRNMLLEQLNYEGDI